MIKLWEIKNSVSQLVSKTQSPNSQPVSGQAEFNNKITNLLLVNRGFKTKKQIEEFLNPSSPYEYNVEQVGIDRKEINKALTRIKKAISLKEQIIIYGDYDADGISATAILWETLHNLKAKVLPFIPHREELGYGLKKQGIDEILHNQSSTINHQPSLIITVDNGIVAHEGVLYATSRGIDVIITDHHQIKVTKSTPKGGQAQSHKVKSYDLPKASAIIWSDKISGAGVAWFLAKEIYYFFHHNLQGFKASNALELASIGTVTDLMPVFNVNRSIIKHGFNELRRSKRPGIIALCQNAVIFQNKIDTYEVGYILGPRINAMGRLENALESLRLLCTKDLQKADQLAKKLGLTNRQRQQLTQTTYEHARLESQSHKVHAKGRAGTKSQILLISHESYNQGVIGLVAGKLVEEFYHPAIVISRGKEFSKGSVRSVKGFDIIKTLRQFEDLFEDIGGHPMAAGFTIATNKIQVLEKKLQKINIDPILLKPKIEVDLEINLEDINKDLAGELEKFSPFGIGNPKPVFVSYKVKVVDFRLVGREQQHLKLKLQPAISSQPPAANHQHDLSIHNQPSTINHYPLIIDAIAFNLGKLAKKLKPGQFIDICYNLDINNWNNHEKIELKIKDVKFNI